MHSSVSSPRTGRVQVPWTFYNSLQIFCPTSVKSMPGPLWQFLNYLILLETGNDSSPSPITSVSCTLTPIYHFTLLYWRPGTLRTEQLSTGIVYLVRGLSYS